MGIDNDVSIEDIIEDGGKWDIRDQALEVLEDKIEMAIMDGIKNCQIDYPDLSSRVLVVLTAIGMLRKLRTIAHTLPDEDRKMMAVAALSLRDWCLEGTEED